jgi:ferrous-iron efflux pump FieF
MVSETKKTVNQINDKHGNLMKRATYFSVFTAVFIIIIKIGAWIYTDSLSVLASLADSVLDVISSILNLFAVHYALRPADEDHRFGHGKAEDIAAFAQSAFIAGSALFITIEAIGRSIDNHPLQNELAGMAVMAVSILLTIALLLYQKYVIKLTNSSVIKSDFIHYVTDVVVNFAVIFSLFSSKFMQSGGVDTLISFAIAAYIFRGAWQVGKGAFDNLMDKEMPDEQRAKITECVLSNPNVQGMHELRTRVSGMNKFIQFHVELDSNISLKSANMISHELEEQLVALFPNAEVIVHQDHEHDENNQA